MRVQSPTKGWNARVYIADAAGAALGDWGEPDASLDDIGGDAEFTLDGAEGQAVLVWITRLGDGNKVEIAEVALEG